MNVNDGLHNLPEVLGIAETARVSPAQRQTVSKSSEAAAQDRTELSTAAKLASQAMQAPDVRMEKVAAVQQALANGTYSVSAEDVAGKLIQHMLGK